MYKKFLVTQHSGPVPVENKRHQRSKSTGNIIVIKRPFTFVYGHKQAITQNFIPNANVLCKQFTKYIIFHIFIPPFTLSRRFCWLRHGWWTYTELGTPNCPATYRQTLAIYRAVALQRKWRHSSNYMFRGNPQKCRLFMTASALWVKDR